MNKDFQDLSPKKRFSVHTMLFNNKWAVEYHTEDETFVVFNEQSKPICWIESDLTKRFRTKSERKRRIAENLARQVDYEYDLKILTKQLV